MFSLHLTHTTTITILLPCALIALIAFKKTDLIKCLYFADTTERGDRG
jgi:hypothetical protein